MKRLFIVLLLLLSIGSSFAIEQIEVWHGNVISVDFRPATMMVTKLKEWKGKTLVTKTLVEYTDEEYVACVEFSNGLRDSIVYDYPISVGDTVSIERIINH